MKKRTEIVAEIGECFNGKMNTAYEMIEEAKKAGCDVVKFQLLDMSEVAINDPEYDWFASLELDKRKIDQLVDYSSRIGIDILFTPVSVKTAEWMYELGIKNVKIASSFVNKIELLEYIRDHFEKFYVSTGMADIDEIVRVDSMLSDKDDVTILHCVSEYPTGPLLQQRGLKALNEEDAHLAMITILKNLFPYRRIGYSDHTDGVFVPILAVGMGAEVIEKHFTLDKRTPIEQYENQGTYMGTDHVLSVEPSDLKRMVRDIRRVETVKGDYNWKRSEGEMILKDFLRGRYKGDRN